MNDRNIFDDASADDLNILLKKLRYILVVGSESNELLDFNMRETKALADIFYTLEDYYGEDVNTIEHAYGY